MFIKHVKSIDNKSLLCFDLFSPTDSRFIFICSSLTLIIVDKHDFLQHFRRYRKMHSINSAKECNIMPNKLCYSMIETLTSFQKIDLQSEPNTVFDHSHQLVTLSACDDDQSTLGIVSKNQKKIQSVQKQSLSPKSDKQLTEVFWYSLGESLVFHVKDQYQFKECLTLEIEKPTAHKCYGRLLNSQLYLLHNNVLYHYQLNLALNGSSFQLLRRLDLKILQQNIYYLSLNPLTLFGDKGILRSPNDQQVNKGEKFEENFQFKLFAKFKWQYRKGDDQSQESRIFKPENFQFIESLDFKLMVFPQPQQQIYLIQQSFDDQQIFENIKLQNIITAAISPFKYVKMPNYENFEELKQSSIQGEPYNVMVLSHRFDSKAPKARQSIINNCIGLYSVQDENLMMIIKQLDYEIDRIYFLTPYDLIYQDSANHVGLIQLRVEDVGLVCK